VAGAWAGVNVAQGGDFTDAGVGEGGEGGEVGGAASADADEGEADFAVGDEVFEARRGGGVEAVEGERGGGEGGGGGAEEAAAGEVHGFGRELFVVCLFLFNH
jgi:hypothetical protein